MKKLVSLLVCFALAASLCVPAFAADVNEPTDSDLLYDVVLQEGERWIPASENAMMPMEEPNAACGISSHRPPSNYRYVGCYEGDSSAELEKINGVYNIVQYIPGLGTVVGAIAAVANLTTLLEYYQYGTQLTTYYKYTWSANGNYWYHIVWAADLDGDGYDDYITCTVQTAP